MIKRCQKCIFPESYPNSGLDQSEVCAFCRDSKTPRHDFLGKDALIRRLTSAQRKGKYDCVVPLSGGKDSTYILYYAVRELQLKPIAVNYDSGFQSPIAKQNIQRACEALNVPLVIKKSRLTRRILKVNFLLLQYGNGFNPCINCDVALRSVAINTAKKYSVPFVLWGSSSLESLTDEHYQKYKQLGQRKNRQQLTSAELLLKMVKVAVSPRKAIRTALGIYRRIRNRCRRIFSVFNVPVGYTFYDWTYRFLIVLQRIRIGVPMKCLFGVGTQVPFTEKPAFIHFFDYIEWDSIRQTNLLKDQLGWEHPDDVKSRFDCLLHSYVNFMHLRDQGISHDGSRFCNMIRAGKATRAEALSQEMYVQNVVRRECEEVSDIIGISRTYLQKHWFK